MNKIYIHDPECGDDIYNIDEMDFDKFLKLFTDIRRKFPNHKIYISLSSSYDDESSLHFYGERLETDKELNDRIEKSRKTRIVAVEREKKKKERKIEREKSEYARLKKIYD